MEFDKLDELKMIIRKHALDNAVKFNGKASAGAVIGKVIGEMPEIKPFMQILKFETNEILNQINNQDVEISKKQLEKEFPEMLVEKERKAKDELKEFTHVDPKKGVIMRFAPSPSGPMHIGHAITGGLTSAYVKKYGGKFILRIEDTNSDNIDPDAYDLLPIDGEWIFGNVTDVWIQSERLPIYYEYVLKLLEADAAYICTCTQDAFKHHVEMMQSCPCRNLQKSEYHARWKKMFDKEHGFKEGEAVLRFKADMQDSNPAMRDFPLARINDSEHPRQGFKYRVWPLMNLSVCVDDITAHMTHIIRAKDHADNAKRQKMMYRALGIEDQFPETYFLGRYNFEGLELSCSKTKARINAGEFWGWDDIRLPFLQALKRKGYRPEAFIKYTMLTGLSPVDKTISAGEFYKGINAFNKELIEPLAKRFFFMHDYEKIVIHNAPHQHVELKLHPDDEGFGVRTLETEQEFLLLTSDLEALQDGNLYRLMDCLNFRKIDGIFEFDSLEYDTYKLSGKKIMHWLPAFNNVAVEILMDDAQTINGVAEHSITQLKVDDIIQFERFGFCRLDEITHKNGEKLYKFWFTHK